MSVLQNTQCLIFFLRKQVSATKENAKDKPQPVMKAAFISVIRSLIQCDFMNWALKAKSDFVIYIIVITLQGPTHTCILESTGAAGCGFISLSLVISVSYESVFKLLISLLNGTGGCFSGIMTGSFYSVSTLLNQMIITHYKVGLTFFSLLLYCSNVVIFMTLSLGDCEHDVSIQYASHHDHIVWGKLLIK